MSRLAKQSVVVYRDGEDKIYDTAYGFEQGKEATRRCAERHGHSSNPRVLYAEDFWAEQLRKRRRR